MPSIIDEIWDEVVVGDKKPEKPQMISLINSDIAIKKIKEHIDKGSKIAIHCDVDVDGIGSGYILGKFLGTQTNSNIYYVINKEKEHGIQVKHAEYFNNTNIGLVIIVDSSSNDLDIVKKFNKDVIVIDHHQITIEDQLVGKTTSGKDYIVVNNTISNKNGIKVNDVELAGYDADDRMSCGLVVYEVLRIYSEVYKVGNILENMRLYQWVGVTLFTDSILLNTPRNQWYIEKTIYGNETETTLLKILNALNPYKASLDKSYINYTMAPVINKAIRAGHTSEALSAVVYNPSIIEDLKKYKQVQSDIIEMSEKFIEVRDGYIKVDLTNSEIHNNYTGVIAGNACNKYERMAIAYKISDGMAKGSFRGNNMGMDYRGLVDKQEWASGMGHKQAFGFECREDKIDELMELLSKEDMQSSKEYLITAGELNNINPGKYKITDMDNFKKMGGIWKLGIGNSKLSSHEQVMITVSAQDARLVEVKGKVYMYDVLGIICKAFEPISKNILNIYVENSRQIDCYIK